MKPESLVNYGSIVKKRNNSQDLKEYKFSYQDKRWHKDVEIRQIIVRITNPKGKTIEVSILSDDTQRSAEQLITLMFSRWIQENDFKYLIKHFGINEITSYRWFSYKDLEDIIEDKKATSAQYKVLQTEIRTLRTKLKAWLLKQHNLKQKVATNSNSKPTAKQKKTKQNIKKNIQTLSNQIREKETQRGESEKLTSKLQALIEQGYKRLDTDAKTMMDLIKIIARNMFYIALKPFKLDYNNFRDDHVIFRNLTCANGKISFANDEINVELFPSMHHRPGIRKIIEDIMQKINQKNPVSIDGSGRKINLKLGGKSDSLFASVD